MNEELSRRLATIAEEAARLAAEPLLAAFRSHPAVEFKRDFHDLVTEHDRVVERTIRAHILAEWPDSAICGEEAGDHGEGAVQWYVDPIDGTNQFAHGLPQFCVSIAAAVDGEIVAGAIYQPVGDVMCVASVDGASRNGEPMSSTGAARDSEALLIASYPTPRELERDRQGTLERFGEMIDCFATVCNPGSAALSLAAVAAGEADVVYGVGINPWDVAAGAFLIKQAGGSFYGLPQLNGEPAWQRPDYVGVVREFDLERSRLPGLVRLRLPQAAL